MTYTITPRNTVVLKSYGLTIVFSIQKGKRMIIRYTVVMAWTVEALNEQIKQMNHLGWSDQERYYIKNDSFEAHSALLINTRQVAAKPLLPLVE